MCLLLRTADEDFDMLLEAAVCYDRRVSALLGEDDSSDKVHVDWEFNGTRGPFPNLFIIVTGLYFLMIIQLRYLRLP
jgi:beta-1,4-mannosyltransferase